MVVNLKKIKFKKVIAHGGDGTIDFCRIRDFNSQTPNLNFIDFVIIKPGNSIGFHRHKSDSEIYLILKGTGQYETDDNDLKIVENGDVIVTSIGTGHKISCIGNESLEILVVSVAASNPMTKSIKGA